MTKEQYRWFIQEDDQRKIPFTPICGDDLALEWARETNQRFYRCKLSDKIIITGPLYHMIINGRIDTKYTVYVEQLVGKNWQHLCQGQFYKTSCTIDYEEQTISVQPDYSDAYNNILANLDKEFNVLSTPMRNTEVWLTKRPMLQLYSRGDSVISCYCGGSYYEVDVQNVIVNSKDLVNKYFFARSANFVEINFDDEQNKIIADLAGTYVGTCQNVSDTEQFTKPQTYPSNGLIEIVVTLLKVNQNIYEVEISIKTKGKVLMFQSSTRINNDDPIVHDINIFEVFYNDQTGQFEQKPGGSTIKCSFLYHEVYTRYLLDVEEIDGKKTNKIPSDDIVYNTQNYKYAIGYDINITAISARTSTEPTEWGTNYDYNYYLPPYGLDYMYYPFAQSTWRWASLWFYYPLQAENLEKKGRKEFAMRDVYSITEIIKSLLKEYAPELTHEATTDYSLFLYGGIGGIDLFLTQKSNILTGEYTQAARKAVTTLWQVLNMLKNCFQCYWFIEGNKLRIEHIQWFKNGGSYFGYLKQVGEDLTKAECIKNGKKWAFKQSEVTYDLGNMPKRYEFSWMDDVSKGFEGYPLEIISGLVDEEKTEDITISGFTSDVDFMLMNPSEISKDGFALLDCRLTNGKYKTVFKQMTIDEQRYDMQNGTLSFMYLQPNYWLYDLPAWSIKINNADGAALDIARNKTSNITIPLYGSVFDPEQLIKTNVGDGEIEKISINLQSRVGKATLRYETK